MKLKTIIILLLTLLPLTLSAQIVSELACRRYTTQDGLPQMQAERVWQDSKGYIYIGTLSGFVRFDGREFHPFLSGRRINIVGFLEHEGKVHALGFRRQWVIDDEELTMTPIDEDGKWLLNNLNSGDLPNGYVLLEDEQEQNRRICRVADDGTFKPLSKGRALDQMTPDRRLYLDSLTGLHIPTDNIFTYHRSGSMLYAFGSDGVYEVKGHTLHHRVAVDWSSATFGLIVRRLRSGQMVVADEHSLYLFDGQRVSRLATGFKLIKDLLVDRWDRLWVATYQGVYCYFNRCFTTHRLTDGNDIVRAIGIDGSGLTVMGSLNGKLLAGGHVLADDQQQYYNPSSVTIGGRVYMPDNGSVTCVDDGRTTRLPLPMDRYQFVAHAGGRLIAGARRDVFSYDPATGAVDTLAADIPHPWCAAADSEERLWVGTTYGLFCIEKGEARHVDFPQNLIISAMDADSLGNVVFASTDSLFLIRKGEVTPLNSQIPQLAGHEIRALHLSPRGYLVVAVIDGLFVARADSCCNLTDVQFFNHLNGFTMIEPLKATIAEQEDGTLWLCGVEDMMSFQPERLLEYGPEDTFVAPPLKWYEHWWVWLVGLLLLSAVIWLMAYYYVRRRQAKVMLRLKREKKQKELQLSAIRLKTIPHFHSNVLAAIEYFVLNNSMEEAARYLKLYSDFTNRTLQDIDRPARTVDEEVDYVTKYLELQKLRYDERLTYKVIVADNVDRKALLPTMLLHTYVENAIKHGISPKPEGGHVDVIITDYDNNTVVTVEDNGIGRRKAAQLHRNSTKMGLRILSEQIQLYNKSNKHHIRQHVRNLKDDEGKIAGTHFDMMVPKDYVYE